MSDAHNPCQGGSEPEPTPERKLPDPAICRARPSGFGDYVDCLVKDPQSCPHTFAFGYHYHCTHPERAKIIARTQAAQPPKNKLAGA